MHVVHRANENKLAYSESRISIRMKHGKSTHCTNKYTHWMCIMRYCLYNILQYKRHWRVRNEKAQINNKKLYHTYCIIVLRNAEKRKKSVPKFPVVQLNAEKWQIPNLLIDFQKANSHTLDKKRGSDKAK